MPNRIPYCINIFFQNPKIFFKKVLGRILAGIVPSPKEVTQVKIGGHTLDMFPYRNYWWKSMYVGSCGVEIAHSIKKYLKERGVFIDVGAGVGYFSAIASDVVGALGQVHCFEPFPANIEMIKRTIKSNPNSNIILNECAVGDDDATHDYYSGRSGNSVADSMMNTHLCSIDETIKVKTQRLDTYLRQNNINSVSLIKIDVEGYEYRVLKGLAGFFENAVCRPPIICEIFLPVYWTSSLSLAQLNAYMNGYGYQVCSIFNPRKRVDISTLRETADVIFMPTKQGE